MKKKRYLITTADEKTWKFDRPVVFLGEWCRLYERENVWKGMDAIVCKPYGLGLDRKNRDYEKATKLTERLLLNLTVLLNETHAKDHDVRFWRILVGHWVRRYVDVMINRIETLRQCLQENDISGSTFYSKENYSLIVEDSYNATWAFNDDVWNNILNYRILELLDLLDFSIEEIQSANIKAFNLGSCSPGSSIKRSALSPLVLYPRAILNAFARSSDAFLMNTYLPRWEEIKLNLALHQVPQYWISPKVKFSSLPDEGIRKNLSERLCVNAENDFEVILFRMLFELMPTCYLEGFAELTQAVNSLPWPKDPKIIFTSCNFDADEVFKLWTSIKSEQGAKYIVGQHGNMYGTHQHWNVQVEELTSDKFLTWGWAGHLTQHVPLYALKLAGKGSSKHNPRGQLLLIESFLPVRLTTWDNQHEFVEYFEDQQEFVSKLSIKPRQNLIVRLHSATKHLRWCEGSRWKDFDSTIKVEDGKVPLGKLIAKSRLVVHSYDSTGILETLALNIPTLAFWQNNLEHLREEVKPHYQLLIDAGIFHLSSSSVAEKINQIWDDVDEWWNQPLIQNARKEFCGRYAKISDSPISDLLDAITSDAAD